MGKFSVSKYFFLIILLMVLYQNSYSQTQKEIISIPLIGDAAPSFKVQSTKGEINFPDDYWQKWVILFSHPSDFTPVCTSELMSFENMSHKFKDLNCELLGLSVDGLNSHISWLKEIKNIKYKDMQNVDISFPIISDVGMEIAKKYGMVSRNPNITKTIRAVFIIDPKHFVRAILYYPETVGRNIQEILRTLVALQVNDEYQVSTPADWQPGEDVVIPPLANRDEAMKFYNEQNEDYYCPSWFMCFKKLPRDKAINPKY